MRKVLSFVLVLAMVLGCVSMAFAAQMSDVKGTKYENAVNALTELGVISGYTDGTYKPENQVTRAQFVALLVKALGYKPVKTATPFKDVPADNQYSGYIAVAYTLGITGGKTKDTFAPNDPVTYNQAIAFIVRGMGYTKEALTSLQGTYSYPLSEIVKAQELKMFKTCETTGNTPATRGDYALFLYDVLGSEMIKKNVTGATTAWVSNGTLLDKLGCTETSEDVADETGVADAVYADGFNYVPYLGKNVVAYKKDGKIFAVKAVKSTELVGKLNAAKDTLTVGDTKYTVVDTAKDYFDALYQNGTKVSGAAFTNVAPDATYTFQTAVSGKKVSKIYSAADWAVTKDKQVKKADLTKMTVANKKASLLTVEFALDNNYEIKTSNFELVGAASLADIKENDIVYVYEGADDYIVKVVVGTEVVTGTIDRKTVSNGVTYYTINGKQYAAVDGTGLDNEDLTKLDVAVTVEARLDGYGKIYTAKVVKGTPDTYGVVLDYKPGHDKNWAGNVAGNLPEVQLFCLADGSVKTVVLDGASELVTKDHNTLNTTSYGSILAIGALVKFGLNEDGAMDSAEAVAKTATFSAVSKTGYIDGLKIADDAIIVGMDAAYITPASFDFEGLTAGSDFAGAYINSKAFGLVQKATLLDKTGLVGVYKKNTTTGLVDMIFVKSTGLATTDTRYAVVAGESVANVDGTKKNTVTVFGDSTEYVKSNQSFAAQGKLYKLTFDTKGYAVFTEVEDKILATAVSGGAATLSGVQKATGLTSFAFTLDKNGISKVNSTEFVVALTDDTAYFKYVDGYFVAGDKSDLENDLVAFKAYKTATDASYATYVLYELAE